MMPPKMPSSPIPSLPGLGSLGIKSSSSASNGPFSGGGANLGKVVFDNRQGAASTNYWLIGLAVLALLLLIKFK